MALAFGYFKLT